MNLRLQVEPLYEIALQASSSRRHAHHATVAARLVLALAQTSLRETITGKAGLEKILGGRQGGVKDEDPGGAKTGRTTYSETAGSQEE